MSHSCTSRLLPVTPMPQLNSPIHSGSSGLWFSIRQRLRRTTLSPPTWTAQRVTPAMVIALSSTVTWALSMAAMPAPTPIKSLAPKPSRLIRARRTA